jgi:eukaryotic-like serine/threonine-protein kinase
MVDLDLSGQTLGEFVLLERIGQGGYGAVYRSEQRQLKRHVVVKVLGQTTKDGAQERFLREAQLASLLDHPYAAHVYASGADDDRGLLWIAMELVQGITLAEWLKTRGSMPLEQLVPLFERVSEVVHAAHERGIIHRDLKPSNVMVIERGGRLFPKLLDFGIAKLNHNIAPGWANDAPFHRGELTTRPRVDRAKVERTAADRDPNNDRLTHSNAGIGSLPYMSPEQWLNASAVGPATDIYSLGIVAYEALTGRVPFLADNTDEFYRLHRHADVPRLGDDFSRDLDEVIQRALAKQPEARYHTALELAAGLRNALRLQPRERLRSSAQQWADGARSPALLLRAEMLTNVERLTQPSSSDAFSALECSFVAASQRRARRVRWLRRSAAVVAAAAVLGGLQIRAVVKTRMAEQIATESAIAQGWQALLHGESSEAARYLDQAYQRGDRSSGVAFMLARALQPRMAELARLPSSSGRMWSATFTPDGKRVLTTDDAGARMWDAESKQLLFSMRHGDTVYQAVFSPDHSQIITAGGDGTVRVWSATTGVLIRELTDPAPEGKQWRYYAVAVAAHFVAAIDTTGTATHIWDPDTGAQIASLKNDAMEGAALSVSADGRWLAATGGDRLDVFETAGWQQVATIAGPRIQSIAFDPAGQRLAVGTYDGAVAIFEIPSGTRVRSLREAGASVDAVAFSSDGARVAAGTRDGTELVWDATSGGLRAQFHPHRDKIYTVEFSRSGDLLLSAGADGSAVISSLETGMPVARLEGPTGLVFAAHFDAESRRVVGASWDGTARIWDAAPPYRRWNSPAIGPNCESAESLVPDQRFVALSCPDHGTRVWDTARDQVIADLPGVSSVEGDFYSAFPAVTISGDQVAIARANTVEIYALPSGQLLRTVTHPAPVNAVAFAPIGHELASGSVDGTLLLTRDDRSPIALPKSSAGIEAVAILTDGRVLSADVSGRLRVIASNATAVLMDIEAPARVRLLRPSSDGARLVAISVSSSPTSPSLWDLTEYRLLARLTGHVGRVFTARFVANGEQIITAGSDGTVRLWSAATGGALRIFRGDSHFLADATLAPDGTVVVAGGSDGILRFWDTSNERLLWTLQAHKSYVVGVHYERDDLVTRGFSGDVIRWSLPNPNQIIEACHAHGCAETPSPPR